MHVFHCIVAVARKWCSCRTLWWNDRSLGSLWLPQVSKKDYLWHIVFSLESKLLLLMKHSYVSLKRSLVHNWFFKRKEIFCVIFTCRAVILFVVEDVTYNICDQRFHEYEIRRQRPDVHVIRRNLTQISQQGHLTSDKRLMM